MIIVIITIVAMDVLKNCKNGGDSSTTLVFPVTNPIWGSPSYFFFPRARSPQHLGKGCRSSCAWTTLKKIGFINSNLDLPSRGDNFKAPPRFSIGFSIYPWKIQRWSTVLCLKSMIILQTKTSTLPKALQWTGDLFDTFHDSVDHSHHKLSWETRSCTRDFAHPTPCSFENEFLTPN